MTTLVDICVRIYDFECIATWAGELATGILELPFETEVIGRGRQLKAGYYWSLLSLVIDTKESAKEALDEVLEQSDEVSFDQAIFLRRQVLAAQFHLKLDDRVAARQAIDRALATLLSLTNADAYRWQFATSFVECLQVLIAVGDVDRARGLYLHAGDYIVQSFSETSIDYVRYRLFESELQQQSGDVVGAATTSAMAGETLESLQLPNRIRAIWEYQVDVQQAFAAVLNGDRETAEQSLGRLEKFINLPKLRKSGKWEWPGQVIAVATRALWQSFNRVAVDQQDLALLRTGAGFSTEVYQAELFDLYRRVALLLAEGAFRESTPPPDFRPIAHDYVAWTRKRARHSFDVFPRPDTVDRLISILLLRLLANEQLEQPGDSDLAITLADIATRTERAFDSEAQALLGMAQSTDDKRLLQQGLRLSSRRTKYEQEEVRRITAVEKSDDSDIGYLKVDFSRRAIHAEFAVELDRIRAHFQQVAPRINSNPLLPTETEIREALRDGEAFVWIVPVGGVFLGSVCVTKSEGLVQFTQFDLAQAQNDVKLLSLSLTATHSADEKLDRQFPAEAAVRLYKTIFEPVEGCLDGIRTVMWSVDLSVMSVPIATLLRSLPTKVDGGFDLRSAEWFVRRFATAYVRTPAALVALRTRSHGSDQLPFRFLGVGDPVLVGVAKTEPQTRLQEDRGSPVDVDFSTLAPLPETRDELDAISRILGDPALVLVGDQATEGQFRRIAVSQYRYLSFATHALVREELLGVRESAIVLTRGSSTDAFDDGLLSASEIADLQLSAEFVALSACNTANVQLSEFAADIPSLATAFAVSGTPATLATLWSVDSESSKTIVQEVFTELVGAEDIGPAEALARAQLAFIDAQPSVSHAHPRFWGAFVVFGDTSPERSREHLGELHVTNIETLTTKGGEILGASADDQEELLVTGFGEWNGHKFASTTLSLGNELGVLWKASTYEVGGGSVALKVAGGFVTTGYSWGGPANPIASPVVRKLDSKGQLIMQLALPTKGFDAYPGPATLAPNGDVILVVLGVSTDKTEKDPKWIAQVFRLSPQLEMLSQSVLDIPGAGGLRASIVAYGDNYLLAVVDDFHNYSSEALVDAMWQRRWCSAAAQTWLFELQGDSLTVTNSMSASGIAISKLEATHSGVLGVGYVAGCDGRRQLSAWTIAGTSMTVLYQEPGIYESSGNGVLRLRDGRTLIVGTTTRTTDVRRIEERQATLAGQVDLQPRLSFSARETRDLVVVMIGRTGQLETRKIVSFGSDVIPNTSVEVGERVLVAGAVGNQASLIELHVPPVTGLTH